MKPGHLNVFDGLRITTEHINYLQGSFHSAVQDIREILGLGVVYSGFEVVAEGTSIRVNPGLAFDYQKNRIACDEPKTIEATFAPGETAKYVCIKYDQVEDGEVEGRFTLVWDSCAVELRPTLPAAGENVIAIAKVESIAQNGSSGLQLTRLVNGENGDSETVAPAPTEVEETELETEPETQTEEASEPVPAPTFAATVITGIKQGVTRLVPVEGREKLTRAAIVGSLFRTDNPAADTSAMSLLLSEVAVPVSFPLLSLTSQTIASGKLTVDDESGTFSFSTTAHGEVIAGEDAISQFGVSTSLITSNAPGPHSHLAELTEAGIAHFPLRILGPPADEGNGSIKLLQHLELVIEVPAVDASGFKITCSLRRRGDVTNDEIKEIQNGFALFEWEALVAWKALGESRL
jgi:hypothetical protein